MAAFAAAPVLAPNASVIPPRLRLQRYTRDARTSFGNRDERLRIRNVRFEIGPLRVRSIGTTRIPFAPGKRESSPSYFRNSNRARPCPSPRGITHARAVAVAIRHSACMKTRALVRREAWKAWAEVARCASFGPRGEGKLHAKNRSRGRVRWRVALCLHW